MNWLRAIMQVEMAGYRFVLLVRYGFCADRPEHLRRPEKLFQLEWHWPYKAMPGPGKRSVSRKTREKKRRRGRGGEEEKNGMLPWPTFSSSPLLLFSSSLRLSDDSSKRAFSCKISSRTGWLNRGNPYEKDSGFCSVSAVFGGILAVLLIDPPSVTRHTAAQEPVVVPPGYNPCRRLPSPCKRECPAGLPFPTISRRRSGSTLRSTSRSTAAL